MAVEGHKDGNNPLKGIGGMDLDRLLGDLEKRGQFLPDPLLVFGRISEDADRKSIVIEQFVAYLKFLKIEKDSIVEAANYVPRGLNNYRHITLLHLKEKHASEIDISLVESLTLQEVALYTNQRYMECSNRLVTLSIGSPEHREVLGKASFWSNMDKRISLAANLSF